MIVHIFITQGRLTAAQNVLENTKLDLRGGFEGEYNVALERVAPGGAPFWFAAGGWVMNRTGLNDTSLEEYLVVVVDGLNLELDTGLASTDIAIYTQGTDPGDDFDLGITPAAAFELALADTVKKPEALARIPEP